ncbi:MAG TPA: glycosyl hydrolase 53 family protein [Candidatus Binatia bacterium]
MALWLSACAGEGFLGSPHQGSSPLPAPAPKPQPPPLPEYRGPATRPFFMGFTQWPADLSDEGEAIARAYAQAHGDILSVMFIGGIPWPEALDGKPFSKDVQANLAFRPPAGKKLFLSISPLNKDRRDLAPYWGDSENQPLPQPWNNEPLNSPRVKRAYLNFALRAIDAMHPNYLAIGVESNVLLSRNPAKWQQLKELQRDTYMAIKKVHRSLPVFFTTDVLHYKRLTRDAKGTEQEKEVGDMMRYSDLFAMSLYPHMSAEVPRILPANFLDFAKRFKKGIAVSESGMTSRNVELKSYAAVLYGSEADQMRFTEFLLKTAARDGYEFVINFATTDSDRLVARLRPPLADLARIWAYIGMQTADRRPKPASAVWDAYLRARYEQAKWW